MKKTALCSIYLMLFIFFPLNSMITQAHRMGLRNIRSRTNKSMSSKPIANSPVMGQKRGIYTPQKLKGLYNNLPDVAKPISPVHGAAMYESGVLEKMYPVSSDSPTIRLVQELYYQLNSHFGPTSSKSKAAYSLTPGIVGLVIGTLETNQLQDKAVRANIIEQWRAEHKNITDGNSISQKKVDSLVSLIKEAYQYDKNSTRAILTGFLYAKADPDNPHDMIHYLSSVNQYMPIFVKNSSHEKTVQEYTPTELDMIKANLKDLSTNLATPNNKEILQTFEEIVSGIIYFSSNEHYPPKVIRASYGYQNQSERPNCVEAAMHDLFNIIVYNDKSKSFDLSLLPSNVHVHDSFKEFYKQNSQSKNVNSAIVGQQFMDLVSNIPNVIYKINNYELAASSGEKNLITLANYFLGIKAYDMTSLGNELSDERRTITFNKSLSTPTKQIIIMSIDNNNTLTAKLTFEPCSAFLTVDERKEGTLRNYLNNKTREDLTNEYTSTQEAQTLLNLRPRYRDRRNVAYEEHSQPASYYYGFDVQENVDKAYIIMRILRYDKNNTEATDYAYYLYTLLNNSQKIQLFFNIMVSEIFKINKKFAHLYKELQPKSELEKECIIELILTYYKESIDAVDFAYDLYSTVTVPNMNMLIASGIWKIESKFNRFFENRKAIILNNRSSLCLDLAFIKDSYKKFTVIDQKSFLSELLCHIYDSRYSSSGNRFIKEIAKELILLGSDIDYPEKINQGTPLFFAILMKDESLIELLINHGAQINKPITALSNRFNVSVKGSAYTGLDVALGLNYSNIANLLLTHGAINTTSITRKTPLEYSE